MTVACIIMWIAFTIGVCLIGRTRELGAGLAFLISLLLSPIAGIVACAFSPSIQNVENQAKLLQHQRRQTDALEEILTILKSDKSSMDPL